MEMDKLNHSMLPFFMSYLNATLEQQHPSLLYKLLKFYSSMVMISLYEGEKTKNRNLFFIVSLLHMCFFVFLFLFLYNKLKAWYATAGALHFAYATTI